MSFCWDGPHTFLDKAISNPNPAKGELPGAYEGNIVLVASSGNQGPAVPNIVGYPACHPKVLAVGASDKQDHRGVWSTTQASQYGTELGVVAPGEAIWTTDLSGSQAGWNNKLAPHSPPYGDSAGNYYSQFGKTSGATPHVAGLAGLLRSLHPTLTNDQIRFVIEKTAEKVGGYAYAYDTAPPSGTDRAHPSGTWYNEMGYGRINVNRALDFADVYIKDNPADDGRMPFFGNFWDDSDIIVRQIDDLVFKKPDDPVKKGKPCHLYVRVTNLGPAKARNVQVSLRAVPFAGTQFVYPNDWKGVVPNSVQPKCIATVQNPLDPGKTDLARFSLTAVQVDQLFGWESKSWHPCLLAEVTCDNDYNVTPTGGAHTWESNNLAQRNLTNIMTTYGSQVNFPFVAGNRLNTELYMELDIDRSRLPRELELLLNPADSKFRIPGLGVGPSGARRTLTLLDGVRLAISVCGCGGILTLAAGSGFECTGPWAEDASLSGAEWVERQGERWIAIREDRARIGLQKRPGELRAMSLAFRVPAEAGHGDSYRITVSQRSAAHGIVGGVTLVADVTE
jgi:hypothetical protein